MFDFDLLSAERTFDGWRSSGRRENQYNMPSTWGQWPQKLEDLSAAPDKLDHACREARDIASHFRVSYDILCSLWEWTSPCFQHVPTTTRLVVLLSSRAKVHTSREA